jgi:hypothetical protein
MLGDPYNVAKVTSLSSKHNLAGFGTTPNSTTKHMSKYLWCTKYPSLLDIKLVFP